MQLDRNQLARSRQTRVCHIGALGGDVVLRDISAADRMEIMRLYRAVPDGDLAAQQQVMGALCRMSLVDERGEPLYRPDETEQLLQDLSGEAIDEIAASAFKVSGFNSGDADEAEPGKA